MCLRSSSGHHRTFGNAPTSNNDNCHEVVEVKGLHPRVLIFSMQHEKFKSALQVRLYVSPLLILSALWSPHQTPLDLPLGLIGRSVALSKNRCQETEVLRTDVDRALCDGSDGVDGNTFIQPNSVNFLITRSDHQLKRLCCAKVKLTAMSHAGPILPL